ncbi:hypothetical protein [Nostoc sp. PCC 7107]|uniref:hypothetical protein n=1 Tax=Nostoc sp. PCC 7107 TaxID=317936 RepID=UPI00029F41C0|nr:hypothetical protein Nos7107_1655 [Nostoc sp. PCC 7107]
MKPVNLAEVLAKTDIELQRLGWTPEQGRDYLIKTYSKRGRTLLTESELLDFLRHLEAQPTPSEEFLIEIIAKTDQEMQRLDVSVEWGRDYLMKTYGKRSRQLLTEDELLDFLAFLESQPSHTEEFIEAQLADKLLTNLVAKTDEEIQRLGLNEEWLRNYLMKTYGKRGRYLLTEEELLEFIQYLESQPTPINEST